MSLNRNTVEDIQFLLTETGGRESFSSLISMLRWLGHRGFSAQYVNSQFEDDLVEAGFFVHHVPFADALHCTRQRWISLREER